MTIDSGWCKITKQVVPDAYSNDIHPLLLRSPHITFIDGQIKLMKPEFIRTWAEFLRLQIYSTIDKAMARGAHVVVLGFDDYAHVPVAKHPTQRRRSDHVKAINFSGNDELPPSPPEEWNAAMRNRIFKTKVVSLVARNVAEKYKDCEKTVILDWIGTPRIYGKEITLPPLLSNAESDMKRGECDIKAFTWMFLNKPLLIDSTDGDFLPMALLQLEMSTISPPQNTGDEDCTGDSEPQTPVIFLHRMKTNTETCRKRGAGGSKVTRREYEFVHVNRILAGMQREMTCLHRDDRKVSGAKLFAFLVAVTGCDFALNLPGIGPSKLWALRSQNNSAITDDMVSQDPEKLLLYFVTKIYLDVYKKYMNGTVQCQLHDSANSLYSAYQQIYSQVHGNAVHTPRILPWPPERMIAHIQNTRWTIQYWQHLHHYPDPLSVDGSGSSLYGWVSKAGRVDFAGM